MNENRVALVTEAGNGLGKTFANILLENNYEVILAACGECFHSLAEEGEAVRGYQLIDTDFTSVESLSHLSESLKSSFGKLDLLINNAEVVNGFGQKIDQLDLTDIKTVYEINFFAVIRIIQLLKPLLEKSEHPKIVNITSAMGDINKMKDEAFCYSNYCLTAYATSKAALNMYTHLQCKEFIPSKIDILCFDPIVMNNCTHNSVNFCNEIKTDFEKIIS